MRHIRTILFTLFFFAQVALAQSNLFIATTDFSTGSTALLPAGAEAAEVNLLGVHSDAVVRFHNDMI